MNTSDFSGFPTEFADFLFSLRFKNTVDALQENKLIYKSLITEPLVKLYHSLMPTVLSISESIITKPSKCVSSMYSDMRFSRLSPLKEYMYIRFREPSNGKDVLGLYFDMGSEHYSYGIRIYKQTSTGMEQIRKSILENEKSYSRELETISKQGMVVNNDAYVKDHFPKMKESVAKQLLNSKKFYIGRDMPINDGVFNSDLCDEIANGFNGLKGLYLLLKNALSQ